MARKRSGDPLYLVDDQQAVVPDEQARIGLGRRPHRGLVEIAELGSGKGRRDEPRQRALASLPRPVDATTRVSARAADTLR